MDVFLALCTKRADETRDVAPRSGKCLYPVIALLIIGMSALFWYLVYINHVYAWQTGLCERLPS